MSTLSLEFSIKELAGQSVLVAELSNPDGIPDSDIRMGWAKKGLGIAQSLMASGKAFPMREGANGPQSASLRFLDYADVMLDDEDEEEDEFCPDCDECIEDCVCDDFDDEQESEENSSFGAHVMDEGFDISDEPASDAGEFGIAENAEMASLDESLVIDDPAMQAVIDRFVSPGTDSCQGFKLELVAGRDSYSAFGGMACPTIALATSVATELRAMAS